MFVGLNIDITLRDPPGAHVKGYVGDVHAQTSTLILRDVYFPDTNQFLPYWQVAGTQIADIAILEAPGQGIGPNPPSAPPVAAPAVQKAPAFVDPAIVGFSREGTPSRAMGNSKPPLPIPHITSRPAASSQPKTQQLPQLTQAFAALGVDSAPQVKRGKSKPVQQPATSQPLPHADINLTRSGQPMNDDSDIAVASKPKKRSKKNDENAPLSKRPNGKVNPSSGETIMYQGKGWRQTPILQSTLDASPQRSAKKKDKQQRAFERDATNSGWATEDATDINNLPEFDFIGNLSKFDKKNIFTQMRLEDDVSDADRLAGHNKVRARPGTYGGKNLHPTEMVLSPKMAAILSRRGSELNADEDSDDFELGDGLRSRGSMSRASRVVPPSMTNSGTLGPRHSLGESRIGSSVNIPRYNGASSSHNTASGSPHLGYQGGRFTPAESPSVEALRNDSETSNERFQRLRKDALTIVDTGISCPILKSRDELRTILATADQECAGAIDVSAGRAIAQAISETISKKKRGVSLSSRTTILFLIVNRRAGLRCISAIRHLLGTPNLHMLVCVAGTVSLEPQPWLQEFEPLFRDWAKLDVLRYEWSDEQLVNSLSTFEQRSEECWASDDALLIVDAIEGPLDRGRPNTDEYENPDILEMIEWANEMREHGNPVLSIDSPATFFDYGLREIRTLTPSDLLCLGVPTLEMLDELREAKERPTLYVADIGINGVLVASSAGLGSAGAGVPFGYAWRVKVA